MRCTCWSLLKNRQLLTRKRALKNNILLCMYGCPSKDDFHKRGQFLSLGHPECFLGDGTQGDLFPFGRRMRLLVVNTAFCCCCWLCVKIKGSSFWWTEQICVFRAKVIHFSSVTPICSAHLKNLIVILAPPIGKTCHGKCEGPFSCPTRAHAHMTSPAERWKPDWIVALFPTNS